MVNFTPCFPGCAFKCPIERKEHEKRSEICCDQARQCCFFCFEDCPIKEEYKNEEILSGILEMKTVRKNLPILLRALKRVIPEFKGIFSLNVITRLDPNTQIPVLNILKREGFPPRPHAKINLGLGRPLKED